MATQSPLIVYKGSLDSINEKVPNIVDGQLLFAVDTKQIYLDYDVENNGIYEGPERIKFGGSTGIWYGTKTNDKDEGMLEFSVDDLDNATDLPSENDLVLNSDGCFYRVKEIDKHNQTFTAIRLTLAGGGGTGGPGASGSSYIDYKRTGSKNRYFSVQDNAMYLTFQAYSTAGEDTELGATIILTDAAGVKHTLGTVNNIGQSWGEQEPLKLDLKPYITAFGYIQNTKYSIDITLFDDVGNVSLKTIPYDVYLFDMTVNKQIATLGSVNGGFTYRCIPVFYTALENIKLFYRVINIAYSQVVQTNYPDEGIALGVSDNNNAQLINISGDIPVGSYKIQSWVQAAIPGTNGQTIVESNPLEQTFIRQSADSSDPILSINFPSSTIEYKQYGTIEIPYLISYRNDTISVKRTIEFTDQEGNTKITSENLIQNTETDLVWTYRFMELGSYKFTLQVGANTMNASSSDLYHISTASAEIPTTASGGLIINFVANKDNDDADRDVWTSTTEAKSITCKLKDGFNWISNGWKKENGETSLHLNNGARFEIDYSPFDSAAEQYGTTIEFDVKISNIRNRHSEIIKCLSRDENDNKLYTGIIVNGDYFTLNSNAQKPIEDYESLGYIDLSRAGMTATYVPDKRVRISFVITPDGYAPYAGMASNMVCTYVNGVLSGFVKYGDDTFLNSQYGNEESNKFIFDSTDADIDIYNLRVYDAALNDKTILGNYFASFADFTEAANRWEENDILDEVTGEVSLLKVMSLANDPTKKHIPYLLMRGGIGVTDKKGNETVSPITTRLPTGKKDYRLVDVCFIDPDHPEKNIGSLKSDERKEWVIYAQGTSSMEYPIKNLRTIYARKNRKETYQLFDNLPGVDLFCFKVDYMESSSAHNTGLGNMLNELYGGIKPPSRLIESDYDYVTAIKGRPCIIFFKETSTDPAELANMTDDYTGYKYIGRYNFNLDKSTHEPFGFYSDKDNHYGVALVDPPALSSTYADDIMQANLVPGNYVATLDETPDQSKTYLKEPRADAEVWKWEDIHTYDEDNKLIWKIKQPAYEYADVLDSIQVWECLDNNKTLTHFHDHWNEASDPDNALWCENFESRYPEYEVQEMSDKRDLQRLVNWLADTNCMYTTSREIVDAEGKPATVTDYHLYSNEPSNEDINAGLIPDDLTPLYPDPANPRLPQVYSTNSDGINTYRGINGFCYDSYDYRLNKFATEFDNYFESNLTMFYYLITELLLMTDSRAKNMMLCTFTARSKKANGESATKWFPIFYDMDTGLALNNIGQLKFTYKDEDWFEDIFNAEAGYINQKGTVNQSYSTLWTNINLTMYDRLKTIYHNLRDGALKADFLKQGYNDNQAEAWCETLINKDAYIKYVEPYINPTSWKVVINACQGTRSLHRDQYIDRRLFYLDTKYAYVKDGLGLTFRINSKQKTATNNDFRSLNVKTNDAMYLVSQYGNEGTKRSARLEENSYIENVEIAQSSAGGIGEQPYYFYNINQIKDFGDLNVIGIQSLDPSQNAAKWNVALNSLVIGRQYTPDSNEPPYELDGKNPPFEYELKINNRISDPSIIKYFPMLETLDISHQSGIGSISLIDNPNLKYFYAQGSGLTSCTFPEGGILEKIYLPSTIGNIKLSGHYDLDTIGYQEYKSNYLSDTANIDIQLIKDEAWNNLVGLSIEQCPKVDTKDILSKAGNVKIYLPDLNWTFEAKDCKLDADGVLESIDLLDKLLDSVGYNGEPKEQKVTDKDGNYVYITDENGKEVIKTEPLTNRSYVGGVVTINNGNDIGINEERLYNRYTRYYPGLEFKYTWNSKCVKAFSLNTHDANGELMVVNSPKFTSNNLATNFTLEKVFGTEASGIVIEPIDKSPTNEYIFTFKGWNTEGVLTYSERDYKHESNTIQDSINAAEAACAEKLIIKWDGKGYSAVNGFDFASAFSDTNQEINIYPTFVATVRTWTATFTDGMGHTIATEKVRYGEVAPVPEEKPIKVELDTLDVTTTWAYPFQRYGSVGETYIIVADKTFEATYATSKVKMMEYPVDEAWFTIDASGNATLSENYPAEAICVPKQVKNINIVSITLSSSTLKRIYFQKGNMIATLNSYCFGQSKVLEYVDTINLEKLAVIEPNAFQNCENVTVSGFANKLQSIGGYAFSNCYKLKLSYLPASLTELGASAFASCTNLERLDLSQCTLLTSIPQNCFSLCSGLTIAGEDLPVGVSVVGSRAFNGATSVVFNFATNYTIKTIEERAFYRAPNVTINELPVKLETIQDEAFATTSPSGTLYFTSMPSTLVSMGSSIFKNDTIHSGVLDFSACSALTKDSFKSDTLSGAKNITSIILPKSLENMAVPSNKWGANNPENIIITYM